MVSRQASTTPTAVRAGSRAGPVPGCRTNRLARPAHRASKYDPGGPTGSARHRPALTIANSTAAQAKARVEPAVKAPRLVDATSPSPIPATVTARRRSGAAVEYRIANVSVSLIIQM